MAYIELYEDVHTAPRQYTDAIGLGHLIGLVIGLSVVQCEHSISTREDNVFSQVCPFCSRGGGEAAKIRYGTPPPPQTMSHSTLPWMHRKNIISRTKL